MGSMKKRLSLLGVVASLAAIAALSFAVPVTQAQAGNTLNLAIVDVSFDGPAPGSAGPFNAEGTIVSESPGSFQCWGWVLTTGATNVSQVYNIYGRGAIMTQGQEDGLLAVVGGTGDFRNVRGEGLQVFTATGFNIEFHLRGARR